MASKIADEMDADLGHALEQRLPRYAAPAALKRRLEETWLTEPATSKPRPRWRHLAPLFAAVGMASTLALGFWLGRTTDHGASEALRVSTEAVNDHLRLLEGESQLEVVAGDLHQVRPWFAGKLDFAPPLAFKGDGDFPLLGGGVARFLDQRVARFLFARRLHKISLFVLPASRLTSRGVTLPSAPATCPPARGFSQVAWQQHDFAYLLVSDVSPTELLELGRRIQAAL